MKNFQDLKSIEKMQDEHLAALEKFLMFGQDIEMGFGTGWSLYKLLWETTISTSLIEERISFFNKKVKETDSILSELGLDLELKKTYKIKLLLDGTKIEFSFDDAKNALIGVYLVRKNQEFNLKNKIEYAKTISKIELKIEKLQDLADEKDPVKALADLKKQLEGMK